MEALKLLGSLLSLYPSSRVHLTNDCLETMVGAVLSNNAELQSVSLKCISSCAPSFNSSKLKKLTIVFKD